MIPGAASGTRERRSSRVPLMVSAQTLVLCGLLAVVAVFLFWPAAEIVHLSLSPWLTTENFSRIFSTPGYPAVVLNTFMIAGLVTVVTLVIGFPLAYYIWNRRSVARILCFILLLVPLLTGVLVKNIVWTVLLGNNGIINRILLDLDVISQPLQILFTRTAVVIAMTHYLLPIMVVPIYASLSRIDRSLLLAARSLGAGRFGTLRLVTLPLVMPGIVTGGIIVFVLTLGFYITPSMLGGRQGQIIPNLIYTYIRRLADLHFAAALSLLLAVVVIGLMPFVLRYVRSSHSVGGIK